MKIFRKIMLPGLAACMLIGAGPVQAGDKDNKCVDLAIGIYLADAALPPIADSYGQLLLILRDGLIPGVDLATLTALVNMNGNTVFEFKDLGDAHKAIEKCGLIPAVVDEIRD